MRRNAYVFLKPFDVQSAEARKQMEIWASVKKLFIYTPSVLKKVITYQRT